MEPSQQKSVVDQVSEPRWTEAQGWERQAWIDAQNARARFGKNYIWRFLSALRLVPRYRGDSWNPWWSEQFEGYRFLPPTVENAIELGCGPYTNISFMVDRCRPQHLILSDPLISTYVRFKLTFVSESYQRASCQLDDHPIEACPFAENYFDLVVMINVLDHVRDARRCMDKAMALVRPGGILILGQDLTDEKDRAAMAGKPGEIGHPIKLDHVWFEERIGKGFEPLINKLLTRELGRDPHAHYATLIYAGRKK